MERCPDHCTPFNPTLRLLQIVNHANNHTMAQPQILLIIQRQARTNAQYSSITDGKITRRITEAV